MCRPLKNGLEYFPLDTDVLENRKVQRLLRKYGCQGFAVYSAVLCDIYRGEGYYVYYDAAYCQDIAFVLNLPDEHTGLVSEVIGYCISLGLFDADLAARENILTSAGIQMRYREVRKRYKVALRSEFLLPGGTESPAALSGKPEGSRNFPGSKKTGAGTAQAPSGTARRTSAGVTEPLAYATETGTRHLPDETSGTTEPPVGVTETLLAGRQSGCPVETERSAGASGTGEPGKERTACRPAEMSPGATGSGLCSRVTGIAAAEKTVCTAKTTGNATEPPGGMAETPAHITETPVCITEAPVNATETPVYVTETPVYATETPVNVTETPVCVTETPTKEKKKERKEKIEERVAGYYNFRLSGKLPAVTRLTPGRVHAVLARVAEYGEAGVMGMLDAAAGSPFLLGENPRHWRADFDWLFKPANFVKVWEGNYVNSHRNETHSGNDRHAGERKREILRMAAEAARCDCLA